VGIGNWKAGQGLVAGAGLQKAMPETVGMYAGTLAKIDDVAKEGIDQGAFPGCVVTVLRKGKMVFQKAYGYTTYEKEEPLTVNTIFDLASVSKVSATNIALMKLYDRKKLDIKAPLGNYLEWLKGTDKDSITIESMMLHQSGLVSFIPFYKEVTDKRGNPDSVLFSHIWSDNYPVTVTDHLFMAGRWIDTMYNRIKESKLYDKLPRYVYSDNNYILLAEVVKSITGKSIDRYAYETFYKPLGLKTTRYKIYEAFDKRQIAPTENELGFRKGLLQGYVHDPGAAMFGNVAGHAGLFSNATDLATLYQMLLNGGNFGKKRYLEHETIDLFTSYQSMVSRRGYGFDKPEVRNDTLPNDKKYPASYVSPQTYGHTGYTGTCVWVDPEFDLVYVFLSNRVYPMGGENRKLVTLNIRSRIQDIIYESIYDKDLLPVK
jgi:CubicO group peptidase (beta-lactamase class C family)